MTHATLTKFGYPDTLLKEGKHWALLVRPAQPTLGSLVLCALSDATAYADLPDAAFVEQAGFVRLAERLLSDFVGYQRMNYLMLMMVDPHVHFHIIPRYEGTREFDQLSVRDSGWPGPPQLSDSVPASPALLAELRRRISDQ